jgi:hypothetical protein
MNPLVIIVVFYLVLAALIAAATFARKMRVRVFSALASLGWAALMYKAASWAESLNYNIWYSSAASKMLDAYIAGLEEGRQEAVLNEMKRMTNELHVTYEQRGNFKELAERAAESLAAGGTERNNSTNRSAPVFPSTNRLSLTPGRQEIR